MIIFYYCPLVFIHNFIYQVSQKQKGKEIYMPHYLQINDNKIRR